jgi:hypothetical protein
MENTVAATDPSIDAMDIAITGSVAATAPMASMATTVTTAKPKPKAKVKKVMTAAERKVQNQKRRVQRVA